ncbi:AfsR/SARP family transcriptional regulator [Actinomadura macra]|uniref:AfsR/SARP family transcriptional regulator n=1 Tax=Actinomadura macra TaxID=46164 RepID=UPI00083209CD|nr:bacterial transcriptional activator domain-containing protein [Actinomadura macra]
MLGPVEAESDGRPVELGGPKKQLLLAVLLEAEGRQVTPAQLLRRVWHEGLREGSTPQETVQSGVRNLRNALNLGEPGANELIPKKDPRYRMTVDAADVDLHRFRGGVRRLRPLVARSDPRNDPTIATLGREALAEWRQGPVAGRGDEALGGLDGQWADALRKELVMQYHEVLVACLGAEIRLGHGPRLVPELEELHQARPLNRQLALHLMRACHQAGNLPRVIEVYEQYQRRVERRFSAGPDPVARDLYRRIVEDDPALRPRTDAGATGANADEPTTEAITRGAGMPSSGKSDIAGQMIDLLVPVLPILTGRAAERENGPLPARAKELWRVLQNRQVMKDLPEAWQNPPDIDTLHAQIADLFAREGALAGEVSAILAGREVEQEKGQITNFGQYYHRGDNIVGTSIKNYHR